MRKYRNFVGVGNGNGGEDYQYQSSWNYYCSYCDRILKCDSHGNCDSSFKCGYCGPISNYFEYRCDYCRASSYSYICNSCLSQYGYGGIGIRARDVTIKGKPPKGKQPPLIGGGQDYQSVGEGELEGSILTN